MKTYQLGLYEKAMPSTLSFKDKVKLAKKNGFDFIELSIDETSEKLARLDWNEQAIEVILGIMEREDFYIQSICLSGHRKYPLGSQNAEIRSKSLEIMEKAIILAHKLGVRYIQLAGYDEYYNESNSETERLFKEGLRKSVIMAATYGIILAFETMETPFMNTVTKSMRYIDIINSPYLQIYPDIGNLTNAQDGNAMLMVKDLIKGAGHIVAAHLKETRPNIFRNLMFGDGHTNYKLALEALKDLGVRIYVAEFWYTDNEDWQEKLLEASTFLRKEIEEVI